MKKLPLFLLSLTFGLGGRLVADTSVVFNEIMYHPATNEPAMEWVELRNQMAVDVDMSGWSVTGGIDYQFPSGTVVPGGGFLVVALSPETLSITAGLTQVEGPFTGRLANSGELLRLRNNNGRVVDEVNYGVDGEWPVAPDGSGASLAKLDRDGPSAPAGNWRASEQLGGTPGADNFPFYNNASLETKLFPIDAEWRYDDSGTDLGVGWRDVDYTDSSWSARSSFTNRPVTTVFNTGVGANGVALTAGSADPHYVITAAAQGAIGRNAVVILNHSAWLANDTASSWIGVQNPGTDNVNFGAYNYQTTFSLAGFIPSTVQLSLAVAVDNDLTDVLLNGASRGFTYSGFAGYSGQLTLNSGFVAGQNTIECRTFNAGTTANPHGFRALLSGSGLAANPNQPLATGHPTYYFRKPFVLGGDPAYTQLKLRTLVADGAVFYLNGVEVYRQNMPAGTIGYNTPALSDISAPTYSSLIPIPTDSLVAGANVLAVEVHQAAGSSDQALLGLELYSTMRPVPPVTLAFNEVVAATNADFWLELVNYGTDPISLDGYVLSLDGTTNSEFVFPAGQSLAGGEFLATTNLPFNLHPAAGDKLYLISPTRTNVLDAVVVKKRDRGRSPDGTGRWLYPDQLTPGAANSFAFRQEIVINEIMYHHRIIAPTTNSFAKDSPEAWIELYNQSDHAVDLTGWEFTDGVSYRFSPGKVLAAGGYLVVAGDAAYLRSLYPAVDIVGNFGGQLAHGSDALVLSDPNGNPADEVHYYDGGHWPEYADGGGSSLELRNPGADNSKAEAWVASDESDKSSWQTYTYRAVANFPAGTQPTQWNDFIFGLLGPGECLIDDIHVTESPAGTPVAVVANGDFESGLTGWRLLGNEGHSRWEIDPDNPGNHVLHLVSTGPQEHMHNHVETTLINNRAIANGKEYEISFRAKALAGNNLLNTRLYFNRVARTTALPVPALNGTPGARNSRYESNIGPTFSQFRHEPVIPQPTEPVTVSVAANDPQGVNICQVWWSVNGGAWNNAPMTQQSSGEFIGSIPGQSEGNVVQFYVRATDGLGAAATYPAAGPDSGALYQVADGQADLSLGHNFRLILSPGNTALLHALTNVMSNDELPCTVVVDEKRAYYDVGIRLKGSERGRYSDIRTSFHLEFPPDDLFRGVHPVMLIDRSGAGDTTSNKQLEIVIKHMLLHAGNIPGIHSDICRVIAPRSIHTGPAILSPRHEDEFVETAYANGGDGSLYELELIYYPTTADAAGYKNPQPDNVLGVDISDLGDDKELYRYDFIIKNHRDADDYRRFITFAKTLDLRGTALDQGSRQVMDVNEWLRVWAFVTLCGVGDSYTFGNNHNLLMYLRPTDQQFLAFPVDMDFSFNRATDSALIGDMNLSEVIRLPANLRVFYAHIQDIIGTTYNTDYMTDWIHHYNAFCPGQDFSSAISYIQSRGTYALTTIANAGGNAPFEVNGPSSLTTSNTLVTLTGTAPVQVETIQVNGGAYPVAWTSLSAWSMTLPVNAPTNVLEIAGYDVHGQPLTNFTRTVTVNYTGPQPDPAGTVVFNEIMYNPAKPDAAFLELLNTSPDLSFDLSGWRVNGLSYTFPPGSVITNGQFLVLANNLPAFRAAYGSGTPVPFGQFGGNLENDGETLTLLRPGANPGEEIEVDKVRYESVPAWPTMANGFGPSLQLKDPAQDNSRVGNWSDGAGWRYYSYSGTMALTASRLLLYLSDAGDLYLDNVALVAQTGPNAGSNYLSNGGFELPLAGTWNPLGNHAGSVASSEVAYEGSYSLHLVATAGGGASGSVRQDLVDVDKTNVYTLSFYYLPMPSSAGILYHVTSIYRLSTPLDVQPVIATPGQANSTEETLPPFPPLWLNEVEPENPSGLTDNQGEHEPWIELYNAGPNPMDLTGFYLADNYSNIGQWNFPAGSAVEPGEFKVVFADGQPGQSTATEWHTNFRLNATNGTVVLAWSPGGSAQVLDYLNYTNIAAGRSYGPYPDGQAFTRETFFHVTPAGTNDLSAPPLQVRLNEWMARNNHTLLNTNNNNQYDDWFELYNPGDASVTLGGYFLTDNLLDPFQSPIPPGYTIPPQGYFLVWADNSPNLNTNTDPDLHVNFRLDQAGEQIGLFGPDGTPVDTVVFEPQYSDLSQGRSPDGSDAFYYLATPTPREPNSSWANRYPVIEAIPEQTVFAGEPFSFNVPATDPDAPAQTLAFALAVGYPAGAAVDPVSGVFSWTPPIKQPSGTNQITVWVTDNGTPPLSAMGSFTLVVTTGLRVSHFERGTGGEFSLTFGTVPGKTYQVEYKDDLSAPDWTPLGASTNALSGEITISDAPGAAPQRFYRVVQME